MIDIKELEHLAPMANEMLSGLHADETMKRRILFAANENKRRAPMPRLVPALLRGAGDCLCERLCPAPERHGGRCGRNAHACFD